MMNGDQQMVCIPQSEQSNVTKESFVQTHCPLYSFFLRFYAFGNLRLIGEVYGLKAESILIRLTDSAIILKDASVIVF